MEGKAAARNPPPRPPAPGAGLEALEGAGELLEQRGEHLEDPEVNGRPHVPEPRATIRSPEGGVAGWRSRSQGVL